jgi:hypothetical protein
MFDVFVAELRCPKCRQLIPTTADTGMQTYIRDDADGSSLGIGYMFDPRDLTTKSLLGASYALIAEPPPGGPIHLLDVWSCPACRTDQWAMVTIADGRLQQIEGVTMTRATLEAANFISDLNADILAERFEKPRTESTIEILRRHLT